MKERVLIVTKFYYRRGGDCVCALNLENMLRANGHEVAVFAMQHPENLPSQWDSYWPVQVNFNGGIKDKVAALKRTFGVGDVARNFKRMLDDFRPDVVHLHNIHSYLSPIVAKLAKKRGIKVVWTLHDYKLICPSYSCLRNGKVCELCFKAKRHVLATRCMKGSLAASAIAYIEAIWWNAGKLQHYTDAFICPSAFMAQKMRQGGFSPDKLHVLCNFVSPEMVKTLESDTESPHRGDYYCYIGRLSEEKGVLTLLEAAKRLPYKLKVAGDGPMAHELKTRFAPHSNIEFLGRLDSDGISSLLSDAVFSVLPSEWYENNPMGIIESLCAGTPAIGAEIGGIPELIKSHDDGAVFESGNIDDLTEKIKHLWTNSTNHTKISAIAKTGFGAEKYHAEYLTIINSMGGVNNSLLFISNRTFGYYCYIGRLSEEKGVRTLLKAASQIPFDIKIAGDGPLMPELKALYSRVPNICFLGRQSPAEVADTLKGARLSVMPSECYENNPLGIIESLCAGTPAIGANIGGIPELIDATCGLTYTSGDAESLSKAISHAWNTDFDRKSIRTKAIGDFTPATHYDKLIAIYRNNAH